MVTTNRNKEWISKWVVTADDEYPKHYVICDNCGYNLGFYNKGVESTYPKTCPCCKKDMTNGVE